MKQKKHRACIRLTMMKGVNMDNFPEYALNGQDIIMTIAGAANIESGVIDYYCIWVPWSTDASVADSGL